MSEVLIAGKAVQVNEEGYLTDMEQWDEAVACEIAEELNIVLGPKHMEVIHYLRQQCQTGKTLNIRRIGKSGVVDIKSFYKLFPGGPLKNASKIAGIPKPASCI
ncbi:MAG: TusE/DsrC/DsvC family sulfur relay protein [Saprospiraceae bacterium]|nr:TusE/DsrC/DsvC family sulfur relay protein [Saprospiraceae bacterium]